MHNTQTIKSRQHRLLVLVSLVLWLGGCSGGMTTRDSGPDRHIDFSHLPDAVPRHERRTRAGNPPSYVVLGKRYHVMKESTGYQKRGMASWYGRKFHGRKTSNGEVYDMYAMTAAHKTLPIPSYLQVTNLDNGKQVVVRVNDRGPFHGNRIIDLSYAAASKLGFANKGTGRVEIRAVEPDDPLMPPAQKVTQPVAKAVVDTPMSTTVASTTPAQTYHEPPQPPTTVNSMALQKQLFLQLGAFVSLHNAQTLEARLKQNNFARAAVQHTQVADKSIYRVRIGPLQSTEEAERLAAELTNLGIGTPRVIAD